MTEKHSERIEEYKAKHRLEKLEGKKVYDKPVIRTGDKAGCYGSAFILLGIVLGVIFIGLAGLLFYVNRSYHIRKKKQKIRHIVNEIIKKK